MREALHFSHEMTPSPQLEAGGLVHDLIHLLTIVTNLAISTERTATKPQRKAGGLVHELIHLLTMAANLANSPNKRALSRNGKQVD